MRPELSIPINTQMMDVNRFHRIVDGILVLTLVILDLFVNYTRLCSDLSNFECL